MTTRPLFSGGLLWSFWRAQMAVTKKISHFGWGAASLGDLTVGCGESAGRRVRLWFIPSLGVLCPFADRPTRALAWPYPRAARVWRGKHTREAASTAAPMNYARRPGQLVDSKVAPTAICRRCKHPFSTLPIS